MKSRTLVAALAALLSLAALAGGAAAAAPPGGGSPKATAGSHKLGTAPAARERIVRDHRGQTRTYRPGRRICAGWAC